MENARGVRDTRGARHTKDVRQVQRVQGRHEAGKRGMMQVRGR